MSASDVEVLTFGCRLNIVESEAMRRAAREAGQGDLVIVNTCAVTNEAVRQARQAIRRAKRENPARAIVVTGCAAQVSPDLFAGMPEVARVIGNAHKTETQTFRDLGRFLHEGEGGRVQVKDMASIAETASHFLDGLEGHTRAFLQVQNGCDHRCTFCIIPYGRGPSRSVPMGRVVDEVRMLVERGTPEIVLTGVDLTSYGADLPGAPGLGALVKQILKHAPELKRLRLSSVDSVECDDDLVDAFASEPRLMPHLHLSLQAGDDMILKRMKRRHSRADAIAFCERLRALRPDIVFGADLIAGFPTETDDMFRRSLELVEACGLTHLHVFPFSPRPGTPAARMPRVPPPVAKERAAMLRAKGEAALRRHLDRQVGRNLTVLTERGGLARAEDFTPLRLADAPHGRFLSVRPSAHDGMRLLA